MFNFNNVGSIFYKQDIRYSFDDIIKKITPAVYWLKQQEKTGIVIDENNFIEMFFASVFAGKEIYFLSGASKQLPENIDFINFENLDISSFNNTFEIDKNVDLDEVKLNFCTSGSTSKPKIIKKTLKNMFVEAEEILEEHKISSDLIFCKTTKFSHLFGATFGLFVPLLNGNPIQIDQIKYPEQVDYSNFVFVSTPAFLSKIEKYDNSTKYAPQLIITAGDKLDEKVYKYYSNKSKILEIYGSTETGVIAYKSNYNEDFKLFKNIKINNKSVDGLEIFSNFFNEKKLSINDKIEFTTPNTFKFLNRNDRVLKINEKRINAIELEEEIKKLDDVKDAYCLKIGEKLGALIVLSDYKHGKTNDDIIKYIKKHLNKFFEIIPQKWRFLPEIPKTETGKTDINKIRKIFEITPSFPTITAVKRELNKVELSLRFSKTSNYFKGHFPDFPILPGVVQVYFAKFFAIFYFDIEINSQDIKKIKFSKLVFPEEYITLSLINKENAVVFEYYKSDEKIASSGTIKK